ncbi:unnamed protein product [Caenorhabditis auriculariae]|uniref:Peptidase metallopeptidase domain-containing protein n=1 Tax=Caenorhabditis auriculariae TaxID=2777116 RepID=A0A8S1HVB1_9PELO|nr:unnamed protein product [Caenorhabditis auriculariae]
MLLRHFLIGVGIGIVVVVVPEDVAAEDVGFEPNNLLLKPYELGQSPERAQLQIRKKRYVVRSKRWRKTKLTWKLLPNNLRDGDEYVVRNTLHRAFNEWATVSGVSFEEIGENSKETDISVAFERLNHGDNYPFDGKDGVVAHAFYPRDGRLHFDADENWTLNSQEGVNLYQTAVHEIGHLLGLEHSVDTRAVMFAAQRPFNPTFQLADDDVRAVRTLFPVKEMAEVEKIPEKIDGEQVVENLKDSKDVKDSEKVNRETVEAFSTDLKEQNESKGMKDEEKPVRGVKAAPKKLSQGPSLVGPAQETTPQPSGRSEEAPLSGSQAKLGQEPGPTQPTNPEQTDDAPRHDPVPIKSTQDSSFSGPPEPSQNVTLKLEGSAESAVQTKRKKPILVFSSESEESDEPFDGVGATSSPSPPEATSTSSPSEADSVSRGSTTPSTSSSEAVNFDDDNDLGSDAWFFPFPLPPLSQFQERSERFNL